MANNREYTRVSLSSDSHHEATTTTAESTRTPNGTLSMETQQQHLSSEGSFPATTTTISTKNDPFAPRNVGTKNGSISSSNDDNDNSSLPPRTISEKVTDKVFAAIWVIVASIIIRYTNSLHVFYIQTNDNYDVNHDTTTTNAPRANLLLMRIIMIGLGINTVLILYLLLYLPYVKGLHDTSCYDVYCPRIIPTMSCIGFATYILLIRATWHIWGFLAPIIISIEGMGLLYCTHFIPVGL